MAVKVLKPTTPGQRGMIKVVEPNLYKGEPYPPLTTKKNRTGGRNNTGRITSRRRGGGHKQRYRIIDFKRNKDDISALASPRYYLQLLAAIAFESSVNLQVL